MTFIPKPALTTKERNEKMLVEFAKDILNNTCGRAVVDLREPDKTVYNAADVPREFRMVKYTYDLHCMEAEVWVIHDTEDPDWPRVIHWILKEC